MSKRSSTESSKVSPASLHELDARAARPARVREQHPEPVPAGRAPGEAEIDAAGRRDATSRAAPTGSCTRSRRSGATRASRSGPCGASSSTTRARRHESERDQRTTMHPTLDRARSHRLDTASTTGVTLRTADAGGFATARSTPRGCAHSLVRVFRLSSRADPGLPRGDALRSRELARRRRRGTAAARRAARSDPSSGATSRTGAASATSRSSRSTASTSRSAPRGTGCSAPPSPATASSRPTCPSSRSRCTRSAAASTSASLLLGTLVSRARADGSPRDQPERRGREPGPAAVRRGTASRSSRRRRRDARRERLDRPMSRSRCC